MNEELKAALEAMKVTLEGKSLDQAKAEIKAFEEKTKNLLRQKRKLCLMRKSNLFNQILKLN